MEQKEGFTGIVNKNECLTSIASETLLTWLD